MFSPQIQGNTVIQLSSQDLRLRLKLAPPPPANGCISDHGDAIHVSLHNCIEVNNPPFLRFLHAAHHKALLHPIPFPLQLGMFSITHNSRAGLPASILLLFSKISCKLHPQMHFHPLNPPYLGNCKIYHSIKFLYCIYYHYNQHF